MAGVAPLLLTKIRVKIKLINLAGEGVAGVPPPLSSYLNPWK